MEGPTANMFEMAHRQVDDPTAQICNFSTPVILLLGRYHYQGRELVTTEASSL